MPETAVNGLVGGVKIEVPVVVDEVVYNAGTVPTITLKFDIYPV